MSKRINEHQIDEILMLINKASYVIDDSDKEVDTLYFLGGIETLGHMLACWLVQVAGAEYCEDQEAVAMLTRKQFKLCNISTAKSNVIKFLKKHDVEVVRLESLDKSMLTDAEKLQYVNWLREAANITG